MRKIAKRKTNHRLFIKLFSSFTHTEKCTVLTFTKMYESQNLIRVLSIIMPQKAGAWTFEIDYRKVLLTAIGHGFEPTRHPHSDHYLTTEGLIIYTSAYGSVDLSFSEMLISGPFEHPPANHLETR